MMRRQRWCRPRPSRRGAGSRAASGMPAELGFHVERVTGIEPALSAWEVCGAIRLSPADSVTCGELDGHSLSDRDYPRALLSSGTWRARALRHPALAVVHLPGSSALPVASRVTVIISVASVTCSIEA